MLLYNRMVTRLQLAPTPKQLAPFLDIDEVLDQKKWEKAKLDSEEIRIITDMINFMKLVLIGQRVANMTAKNRLLSANSAAINAFNIANKGFQQLTFKDEISFDKLVEKSIAILSKILGYDKGAKRPDFSSEELDNMHFFFKSIANVVLSSTYIP